MASGDMDDGVGFDMIGTLNNEREQEKADADLKSFEEMLKKKKKKKKKKKDKKKNKGGEDVNGDGNESKDNSNNTDPLFYFNSNDNRDYPYTVLLDRIFDKLTKKNPNLIEKQEHKLPPPLCQRVGSKKTGWSNFNDICIKLSANT